jgi:hypothetical protein
MRGLADPGLIFSHDASEHLRNVGGKLLNANYSPLVTF